MHVAIVSETYPPDVNGVAISVRSLEQGLRKLGHRISLVLPGPESLSDQQRLYVRGLALPRYPEARFGLPAGPRLRRRWRQDRPDVIYVATEGPLGANAISLARRLGIPNLSAYHTRFDHYLPRYGLGLLTPAARWWLRHLHNRSDLTLAATRGLRAELAKQGYRHLASLPLAVDSQRFHPCHRDPKLRASWGVAAESPVLLCVGRLATEKNLPLAIRAFRFLQLRRPEARLVLVGEGPLRPSLQRENPDLIFTGALLGRELARHYASADLFVFPSLTETFGLVTLEAMASGLAVVAFDEGAAAEHIDNGRHGQRIALGNETAFIRASLVLAGDMTELRRLGCAARAKAEQLTPDAVARQFEWTLARLTDSAAASAASLAP